MGTLNGEYPESLTALSNQSREAFEQEARMAMATKLFELGRLPSGQAAKVAGVSRVPFFVGMPSFWSSQCILGSR